jgi:hypothetical protein
LEAKGVEEKSESKDRGSDGELIKDYNNLIKSVLDLTSLRRNQRQLLNNLSQAKYLLRGLTSFLAMLILE